MKNSFLLLWSLLAFAYHSFCQDAAKIKIEIPDGPVPWSSLNLNNNPATFQFAIVTDRTGGHRPGVFSDGIRKLNLLQPEFVMSVGDLIEGYTEDTAQLNWEWKQFNGFIDSLDMPFFYTPGNHDITNKVMEEKWEELFGKTYYHFLYKDVLFLCLNSEDNYRGAGKGTIDDSQFEYIKKTLEENTQVKWTLVFMHQPLWNQTDTKRWKDVEQLLKDRNHTVFVGHNHRYRKYDRNNGKYFILATTGGGSRLRGPNFGEFDHVVWVTMTDDGPIIANLLLDGIWHENVMTNDFADFIYPVSANFPIQIQPIFIDDNNFVKGISQVKITNSSDYNMSADFNFFSSKNLIIEPGVFQDTINPNDVREISLNLEGVNITNRDQIDPLKMNVTFKYDIKDRSNVEIEHAYNIRPAIRYDMKTTGNSVKIDGKLNEWDGLEFEVAKDAHITADPFSHKGDKDVSSFFSVVYDEKNMYIAAKVIDDEIIAKDGESPLRQDAAFIFIDARPVGESSMNAGQNLFSDWILIAISPDREGTVYRKNQLPKGFLSAIKKTKQGYDLELAIPTSYLNEKQIDAWKTVRFNLMINDYDQGGNHSTRLSWQPLWNENGNYIGSGTFFRKQ
ncbi:MAG: metallophosphoesterase [Cytophagales bacterium]|nr:metallophosphoesterase [Cytophagales bacterium]